MKEIYRYNQINGITSAINNSIMDGERADIFVSHLNSVIATRYYWAVSIFEAVT